MTILGSKLLKVIFTIGMIAAYIRTAEAMYAFTPSAIFGLTWPVLLSAWAYICAFMVEGLVLVAGQLVLDTNKDKWTRLSAGIAVAIAICYSGLMNVIDQGMKDGRMVLSSADDFQIFLGYVVMLLPIIISVVLLVVALIDVQFADHDQPSQLRQRPQSRYQEVPPTPRERQMPSTGSRPFEAPVARIQSGAAQPTGYLPHPTPAAKVADRHVQLREAGADPVSMLSMRELRSNGDQSDPR